MRHIKNETNATSVQVVSYAYKGNPIPFMINGNVMINATKMAKPFGSSRRPKSWLALKSTKDFLNELSKGRILPLEKLVQVKYGGSNPGTWVYEDVALEFERWLSPAFAIWCNDRIKEILLARMNGTPVVQPKVIDTTEKDREITKWKNLFSEAMATVKSMHESNKLAQDSFNIFYSMMKGVQL